MDMYQKRKVRTENKKNNNKENATTVSLNWYIPTYGKLLHKKEMYIWK